VIVFFRTFAAGAVLIGAASSSGCGAGGPASASMRLPEGWPSVLRYNIAVDVDDATARTKRGDLVQHYLERELGIPVEITSSIGYGGTIEAFRAKKIESASMGSFAYILASEKANVEAIATRTNGATGAPGDYAGTLMVRADSPLHSPEDLVKHAKELTVSFVDPASTSGYLVERAYLDTLGIDPEHDFKKMVFSNNHVASVMTLLAGKADVAAVEDYMSPLLVQKGKLKPGEVRAIWTSPRIPNSPIVVRKDLPASFKKKLQDAFVAMATKAPDVFKGMRSSTSRAAEPGQVYVAIDDSIFNGLRQMARSVKHTELLEH
jgi:phosphonate transport system substrate-binding protein